MKPTGRPPRGRRRRRLRASILTPSRGAKRTRKKGARRPGPVIRSPIHFRRSLLAPVRGRAWRGGCPGPAPSAVDERPALLALAVEPVEVGAPLLRHLHRLLL